MSTNKIYNLEDRTFAFAKDVRLWVKDFNITTLNNSDINQVIRSSGSVGANLIEANEKLSDKDFLFRMKISRKEAKETIYWLKLLIQTSAAEYMVEQGQCLVDECEELRRILSAIINKQSL